MSRRRHRWAYVLGPVGLVATALVLWVAAATLVYPPPYVYRVLAWRESDLEDYLDHFPLSPLDPSPEPFLFRSQPDEPRVRHSFETVLGVPDFDAFLAQIGSQAFIVIQDDRVLYERYFSGARRDSMLTSFSVAKSFTSALVGIAVDEGFIESVDDPITRYLPELAERDERFSRITIRHLLQMASGLDYDEMRWALFNGDDPLTTYHPDQRKLALENTTIVDPPGRSFRYNKYHPQLLGMILERATGRSVTEYTQEKLWDPLGMEFGGAWALDSEPDGFEKMEAGLNARAIDYAKLGRLFLEKGAWQSERVVSAAWVRESTSLDPSLHRPEYYPTPFGQVIYADGRGYYKYMWYGRLREGDASDFAAEGDHGQFIYVSPAHRLIVVRNGTEFGLSTAEWMDAFYRFAGSLD